MSELGGYESMELECGRPEPNSPGLSLDHCL